MSIYYNMIACKYVLPGADLLPWATAHSISISHGFEAIANTTHVGWCRQTQLVAAWTYVLSTCLLMLCFLVHAKLRIAPRGAVRRRLWVAGIFVTSCKPNLKGATSKKAISPKSEVSEPSQLGSKRQSRYPWPWCRVQCCCLCVIGSPPLYDVAPSFRLVVLISREWWPVEVELHLVMEVNILDSGSYYIVLRQWPSRKKTCPKVLDSNKKNKSMQRYAKKQRCISSDILRQVEETLKPSAQTSYIQFHEKPDIGSEV